MRPYYSDESVTLFHGDCLDVMRTLPDASVDAVVTADVVDYAGVVWCITVPHGAFIARRNGLIFATGNSGFPKSLDVSKAIDKAARGVPQGAADPTSPNHGRYRTTTTEGKRWDGDSGQGYGAGGSRFLADGVAGGSDTDHAASGVVETAPDAEQWQGWGTAADRRSHPPTPRPRRRDQARRRRPRPLRPRRHPMTIRAKDQAWCAICHDMIVGGERIVQRKGLWVHATCWEREHE